MRYFYMTIHTPYVGKPSEVLHPAGEPDSKLGWIKAWSDITSDGIFAVYRKEDCDKEIEEKKRNQP